MAHGGRSLSALRHPSAAQVAGIVAGVSSTLADLHEIGITHGRLEVSHVLIGDSGGPRLCGLGDGSVPACPEDDVAAARPAAHRPARERRGRGADPGSTVASAASLARVGAAGPAPAGRPRHRRGPESEAYGATARGGRERGGSGTGPRSSPHHRRHPGDRSDRTAPAAERCHPPAAPPPASPPAAGAGARRGGWPARGGGRAHGCSPTSAPPAATPPARAHHQHHRASGSPRRSPAPCWWPTAGDTGLARTGTTCWSATGGAMGSPRPRPSGLPPTRSSCSTAGPRRSPSASRPSRPWPTRSS